MKGYKTKQIGCIVMLWIAAMVLSACSDKNDPDGMGDITEPTFAVNTDYTTFFVNEPVTFRFSGNADIISFYSGEIGNDYSHKDEARIYEGFASISFASAFAAGKQAEEQAEEDHEKKVLTLYWSTDFTGDYTRSGIESATWHDITDYFIFPVKTVGNAKDAALATPSGKVLLSDFLSAEDMTKPVYFAFRYKVDAYDQANDNTRPHACIRNFLIESESLETDKKKTNAIFPLMSWKNINYGYEEDMANDNSYFKPSTTDGYLWFSTWSNGENAAHPSVEHISWAVSNPVDVTSDINVGCDVAVGIKSYAEGQIEEYTYYYEAVGRYEVVFYASNVGIDGKNKNVVRKLGIDIVEEAGAGIERPGDVEWK